MGFRLLSMPNVAAILTNRDRCANASPLQIVTPL